jgi:hypothetical protein
MLIQIGRRTVLHVIVLVFFDFSLRLSSGVYGEIELFILLIALLGIKFTN